MSKNPMTRAQLQVLTTQDSDRVQLENGAFANYIVVKGDIQLKTPDNLSDEDAATIGISFTTVVRVRLHLVSAKYCNCSV